METEGEEEKKKGGVGGENFCEKAQADNKTKYIVS